MASKKEEKNTVQEKEKIVEAPKEGYVKYTLPYIPGKKRGDYQTVTLNGKNYQVQYGEEVEIPIGVKNILEGFVRQTYAAQDRAEELAKEKCISIFN